MFVSRIVVFISILLFVSVSFGEDLTVIASDIRSLTKEGKLKQAFKLSSKYEEENEDIAMQHGKISLLLGREAQGLATFKRLANSPLLNISQKENLDRFLFQFELSLKKRLKKAKSYQDKGHCEEAQVLYKSLLHYQSTKDVAKKGLASCDTSTLLNLQKAIKGRVYYKTGYDSNVSLDNEDTLSNNSQVFGDAYQKLALSVFSDTRSSSAWWLQGGYNLYQLDYFSDEAKAYDQLSHRVSMKAGGQINTVWRWQIPVAYRGIVLNQEHYADYMSVKARITHRRSKWNQFIEYGFQEKSYTNREDSNRDGDYQDLVYGIRIMSGSNRLFARLGYRYFDGPLDNSDEYARSRLSISATKIMSPWLYGVNPRLQLGYSVADKQYKGIDQALVDIYGNEYAQRRKDLKHKLSIEFKLLKSDWQVALAFQYQRRESSLPIYQYNRNITELGVQYRF